MTESPSFRPQETILGDSVVANPVTMEESDGLGRRIRAAVLWRSGSQIAGQMIAWAATFFVIRILSPADYGLYAMTQGMLMLFAMAFWSTLKTDCPARPWLLRAAVVMLPAPLSMVTLLLSPPGPPWPPMLSDT